jgi:hypothetical protein
MQTCGYDSHLLFQSRFVQSLAHEKFRYGAAHDVAKADKNE